MNGGVRESRPVALVAAMWEEIDGLRKRVAVRESLVLKGWRLFGGSYAGRELLLMQTGPGRERAEGAVESLLERYPVGSLLSFGFGGALTDKLEVGDLVVCAAIRLGDDPDGGEPCEADPRMVSAAVAASKGSSMRVVVGSGVTVDRLVTGAEERERLHRAFGAGVVDMESYWVGRLASARSIPFLALRAISDTPSESLLPFDRLLGPTGELNWREFWLYFLSHPRDLVLLPAIWRNSRRAAASLTGVMSALVPRL